MKSPLMQHKKSRLLCLSFLYLGSCLLLVGCQDQNVYQPPPPPTVSVAKPIQHTVEIFLEENGETEAVGRSEVRARVQGFLEEMKFDPGKEVTKGDVLYVIEKEEYIAIRDAAKAELAASKASLNSAAASINVAKANLVAADVQVEASESEFRRQDQLYKEKVTTKSVWEEAKAIRDGALASQQQAVAAIDAATAGKQTSAAEVTRAEAKLQQAELNLSYTDVRALITGRIANTKVKLGNLVDTGTHLTTIIQRNLIWVNFNINERALLALMKEEPGEEEKGNGESYQGREVFLQRAGDKRFPFKGHLDYIDQEGVDQQTGTFMLRGVFENPDLQLVPGLFVRVRVQVGVLEDAILVPEQAIGRDQSGTFLLVLDDQNVVERKKVTLGPKYEGMLVIQEGLDADATVIIDGIQRARPGIKVTPKTTTLKLKSEKQDQTSESEEEPEKTKQAPEE